MMVSKSRCVSRHVVLQGRLSFQRIGQAVTQGGAGKRREAQGSPATTGIERRSPALTPIKAGGPEAPANSGLCHGNVSRTVRDIDAPRRPLSSGRLGGAGASTHAAAGGRTVLGSRPQLSGRRRDTPPDDVADTRRRDSSFDGRCYLCGQPIDGGLFCHAHGWAARAQR
jgi:hypothetical protein